MTGDIKPHYEVIVIGAGVAGIYQIKRLADLGVDALVLDAAPDLGGTWYWNRYPGRALRFRELHLRLFVLARSCSTSGTGRSASPASRRTCATSTTSPTSSICANTCSSTARSRRRRFDEAQRSVAAPARRRPRADLPVRHSRGRVAVDADAAAAGRHGRVSRGARSTPSTGRTSRSSWPARRSASSAPAPPRSR